jgi:prepilin-type N-terminal cleavage/methylation domain-containing protein
MTATGRSTPSPRERGFTIVEVIIAIIVLTVGLLGLMTTAALVTRMIAQGQRAAIAATFTGQMMEEQRLQGCNPARRVPGFRDLYRGSTIVARVVWWWVLAPAPNHNNNTWQLRAATLRLSSAGRWKVDYTETSISCIQ